MSFTGSKNIATIEKDFDKIFGLTVQICYSPNEDSNFYTHGSLNKKSLTEFNRECENGIKIKPIWELQLTGSIIWRKTIWYFEN